jgi:hypothetical protein
LGPILGISTAFSGALTILAEHTSSESNKNKTGNLMEEPSVPSLVVVTNHPQVVHVKRNLEATSPEFEVLVESPSRQVRALAPHPQSMLLAVGTASGEVFLFDYEKQAVEAKAKISGVIGCMFFSYDGRKLFVFSDSGMMHVLGEMLEVRSAFHGHMIFIRYSTSKLSCRM